MRKPKFRVGQVVYFSARSSTYPGFFIKLLERRGNGWFMCCDGYSRHESRFRPLTDREIGPRRKVK